MRVSRARAGPPPTPAPAHLPAPRIRPAVPACRARWRSRACAGILDDARTFAQATDQHVFDARDIAQGVGDARCNVRQANRFYLRPRINGEEHTRTFGLQHADTLDAFDRRGIPVN